jgi:hypothetical protein
MPSATNYGWRSLSGGWVKVAGVDASSYRYLGNGTALALEVTGPTIESCLARAVEGFAGAFADVHPSLLGRRHRLELRAGSPAELLRALLEEAIRLGAGGELALALTEASVDGDGMRGEVEAVPMDEARVYGTAPAVRSWHDLTLERCRASTGWIGRVVATL